MKANVVRCAAEGSPEVMRMESVELSAPGPGEVLVRQIAIGLREARGPAGFGHGGVRHGEERLHQAAHRPALSSVRRGEGA